MQSIVEEALKYTEMEREQRNAYSPTSAADDFDGIAMPQIKIMGCGGAGNNTINRLSAVGVEGAGMIAINTDKQHLDVIKADKKILIGKSITRGLGAGGEPEKGRRAAEMARRTLKDILKDADLVFVTAGMGGGTGTGSAPVVAQVAKECGAIVIGMVSTPFRVERHRIRQAEQGLEEMRKHCHTVVVLDNNRLLSYAPNLPLEQSFSVMDQLIASTVKGISETITKPSLINLDYADVRAVMNCGGVAVMLVGETSHKDRAESVVRECLQHPLLDVEYRGATGALIHITGGPDLTLAEAESIASSLTYELDQKANVIWGARIQKEFEGRVRVLAIMTGVHSPQVLSPDDRYNAEWRNTEYGRSQSNQLVPVGRGAQGHMERDAPPIDIIPIA